MLLFHFHHWANLLGVSGDSKRLGFLFCNQLGRESDHNHPFFCLPPYSYLIKFTCVTIPLPPKHYVWNR